MSVLKECAILFRIFFKIGCLMIGGGYVMLPMLEQELVEKRGWLTEKELMNYYAVAQSTPGAIAVNTATFVGFTRAGIWGALTATISLVLPGAVLITIAAGILHQFQDVPWVLKLLKGLRMAVSALLIYTVWTMGQRMLKKRWQWLVTFTTFLALAAFQISPVFLIISALTAAILTYYIRRDRK